jgi:hypothetical protein
MPSAKPPNESLREASPLFLISSPFLLSRGRGIQGDGVNRHVINYDKIDLCDSTRKGA